MTGGGRAGDQKGQLILTDHPVPQPTNLPLDPVTKSPNDGSEGQVVIGTVILDSRSNDQKITGDRIASLKSVIRASLRYMGTQGLLLFPAGWIYTGDNPASIAYNRISDEIKDILTELECNYQVCVGIDGCAEHTPSGTFSRDQISIACDRTGTIGLARKFYPSDDEVGHVNLAAGPLLAEGGYSRIIKSQGKKFFMSVCFDIAATYKMREFRNPGVDGILNLVHCFYPRGQGPSGSAYFARHKFAGAAKEWQCPVYGAASFFINPMPELWPSGVIWNQGDLHTPDWKYSMNPLTPTSTIQIPIDEGRATIRYFEHLQSAEGRVR